MPHSPVLLGCFAQNGLQKRIEASEGYLPVSPVIGRVAEDVQQLLAGFLVKLGMGWNVLKHHNEAGLLARFVNGVRQAVVQRIEILAEMGRECVL